MKLFENYLDGIKSIMDDSNSVQVRSFSTYTDQDSNLPKYFKKGLNENLISSRKDNIDNKVLINFESNHLTSLFGPNDYSFPSVSIGNHPDFSDLNYSEYENHFCVSMFMDIKGSTRLIERFSLLQIRKIKDTVLTLAIHIATHFGGHIHRLQGDAIFVQFVRKKQKEQDAVVNALNAASVITHFISADLADIFIQNQLKPLKVRIGIDYGKTDDVIWSHYGVPGCSELTTTSLHTDLAAKLQARAGSNEVLIGGNIKEILDIKPDFCSNVHDSKGDVDYYIYEGVKKYRKFNFDWQKYLLSFDFIKKASDGKRLNITVPNARLTCSISNSTDNSFENYYPNSRSINKNATITFRLQENGRDYNKKDWESIEWKAFNSGKQAKDKEQEIHNFGGEYDNKIYCKTTAAFTGHHYVECIIKRPRLDNIKITFPIYVD